MEIRQLKYLCAIAEHGSFRKASAELLIAQPALSQQVRRLEAELGVSLFDRTRRPVELTPAGQSFMPRARQILGELERAAAEAREFAGEFRGRVAVGAMQYLTSLEVPDLLLTFGADHPGVQLQLRVGNSGQLRDLLLADAIDVAVAHAEGLDLPPQYAVEVLRPEELVILVDRDNPLASLRQATVQDLENVPFILFDDGASMQQALRRAFSHGELELNVALETGDLRTAVSLVARGFGVAVVPRSIAQREMAEVTGVRIGPVPLMRHVALAWNRDRHRSRALEAFSTHARRFFAPAPNSLPSAV
jgi:DNA-binding transcriptional LysR family regulator